MDTTLTIIEHALVSSDQATLCRTLRDCYATDEPLTDEERDDLIAIRETLTLVELLLAQRTTQITSPWAAATAFVLEMSALRQEEVRVLLLDRQRHVINTVTLYRGTLHSSVTRIAEFFYPAIVAGAESILVIHNHPSGDVEPSPEDGSLTRKLAQAGALLDIELVDHIIIAGGRFLSLKERGFFTGTTWEGGDTNASNSHQQR